MILEPFQYFSPSSISRAQELLLKYGDEAKILAGGQSLIPIMKLGTEIPCIVDIKNISELSFITDAEEDEENPKCLEVGSLTKFVELQHSETAKENLPLISLTASGIGHPLIRNRGTIGGSLSHCDPSADLCVTSLALDGTVKVITSEEEIRKVPVEQFFKGPLTTDLKSGEILYSISFPIPKQKTGYGFQKLTLGHGDFPLLVVSVKIESDGTAFRNVRIAYGGVAETAVRSHELENMLEGREIISEIEISSVCDEAMRILDAPISSELSQEYLKKMVGVYTGRALRDAVNMITG